MGNNASSPNINESESRQRRRSIHNQPPSTSGSEDTLTRRGYTKKSRYSTSSAKLPTSKTSERELDNGNDVGTLLYKTPTRSSSGRVPKSKSILRPQSAPQAETTLDDMLSEDYSKTSKQKLYSSSGVPHKSHYHFKRKQIQQKGTNTDTEDDSSSDDIDEQSEQVRPTSRQSNKTSNNNAVLTGVVGRSKTYVQETDLDDQKITVEVKVTSAPKDGESEISKESQERSSTHDHHHHHQHHQHHQHGQKKKAKESLPSEENSSEEEESESEESVAETEIAPHTDAPKDPTVASKLLDSIKKDMTLVMAQEQRKTLMKTDPVLQVLNRANTNELILTNLPLSTTIADVHEVFHTAVGIRLGVESIKRESKLAKIAFDSKNDALDAYVIGRHKKINGAEVIFGIRREDPPKRKKEKPSQDEDGGTVEPDEAEYPPSEKVDKDDLIRNWVKFQEETYEPSKVIQNKKSSSSEKQKKKSK